ncbi:glycosyltransferase 87 family protein [Streptomyces sp. DSM 41527]|uniref:Glycosyltransferase 87 family protein n=1 Tax=Streptomyces mooreae TaxID=3075523 RepID=A0ABU2TFW0_9ACTN|nr:glycosyltransferase 87 family protein [Streptomyces sp. DSM 41527]MDT0459828.1 glycosyltransferase 87 family protein [Streptomyces sp. DSM 41527]
MSSISRARGVWLPVAAWAVTRGVILLCVLRVLVLPGPDVTTDVSVIYQNWSEILKSGTFPLADVTWQYPPAAALAILSPGLLPFLDYAPAFYALILLTDAAALALFLRAGRRPGHRPAGAWVWIAGVALLGPTAYARYDLMVTAVAVAALFAAARRPRVAGALVAFGALLKVWPVLLLTGAAVRGRRARALWWSAAGTAAGLTLFFVAAAPGALAFLTFQRDRGTEVESLGALVFHIARQYGWDGQVLLHYGSLEFLGPGVPLVSTVALTLSLAAVGWLFLWRLRAGEPGPTTLCDAAFAATLLFTTTSRVISPQYMLWLVGLAAVCVTVRAGRQTLPAVLVLLATGLTQLEFPVWFAHVVASDLPAVVVLAVRNGLLVAASLLACRRLWVSTRGGGAGRTGPPEVVRARRPSDETTAAPPRLTGSAQRTQTPADGSPAPGR